MAARSRTIFRAVAGVLTLVAVAVQYALLVGGETGAQAVTSSIRFFSFFTILSNLIAAAALLAPVVAPRSVMAAFLERPSVRTAVAGYMIMVGAIYYLLLVGLSHRAGLQLAIEHVLHAVTPPLFVVDWLLFVDKRRLHLGAGLRALLFPLVYVGWTFLHGALSGWYPYPFIDVSDLGYARVLANVAGLVGIFVVLEALLVVIGRRIGACAAD